MKPAPFTCSVDAEKKIRSFLRAQPHADIALTLCESGELRDPKGEVLLKFQGDHFFLEHHRKGELPADSFYTVDGLEVSVSQSVLERVRGRKLVEKHYRFGSRHFLTLFFPRYHMGVLTTV